jgi:hypothetical protein
LRHFAAAENEKQRASAAITGSEIKISQRMGTSFSTLPDAAYFYPAERPNLSDRKIAQALTGSVVEKKMADRVELPSRNRAFPRTYQHLS